MGTMVASTVLQSAAAAAALLQLTALVITKSFFKFPISLLLLIGLSAAGEGVDCGAV